MINFTQFYFIVINLLLYFLWLQFKSAVLSGWKFSVLTPVFYIHWGFQTTETVQVAKKDGIGKAVRHEQIRNNRNIYDKFVKELQYRKEIGSI